MAKRADQKVHTSATVLLQITVPEKGTMILGVGQNATGAENYNLLPVPEGFGSIMPLEIVPTEWSANISIDKFFLRKSSLVELDIAPTGEGILNMPPIDIAFLDTNDEAGNMTIFTGCTLQSREFTVAANAIVGERANWLALNVQTPNPELTDKTWIYEGQ